MPEGQNWKYFALQALRINLSVVCPLPPPEADSIGEKTAHIAVRGGCAGVEYQHWWGRLLSKSIWCIMIRSLSMWQYCITVCFWISLWTWCRRGSTVCRTMRPAVPLLATHGTILIAAILPRCAASTISHFYADSWRLSLVFGWCPAGRGTQGQCISYHKREQLFLLRFGCCICTNHRGRNRLPLQPTCRQDWWALHWKCQRFLCDAWPP